MYIFIYTHTKTLKYTDTHTEYTLAKASRNVLSIVHAHTHTHTHPHTHTYTHTHTCTHAHTLTHTLTTHAQTLSPPHFPPHTHIGYTLQAACSNVLSTVRDSAGRQRERQASAVLLQQQLTHRAEAAVTDIRRVRDEVRDPGKEPPILRHLTRAPYIEMGPICCPIC